jgi:hypothetical protein
MRIYPTLFRIGGFEITSFGVMVALYEAAFLAILAAIMVAWRMRGRGTTRSWPATA